MDTAAVQTGSKYGGLFISIPRLRRANGAALSLHAIVSHGFLYLAVLRLPHELLPGGSFLIFSCSGGRRYVINIRHGAIEPRPSTQGFKRNMRSDTALVKAWENHVNGRSFPY